MIIPKVKSGKISLTWFCPRPANSLLNKPLGMAEEVARAKHCLLQAV